MDVHFVEWALEVNIICEIIWNRITVQMFYGFCVIMKSWSERGLSVICEPPFFFVWMREKAYF
jgi:hypothetical protein